MGVDWSRGLFRVGGEMTAPRPAPTDREESGGDGLWTVMVGARDERQDVILDWAVCGGSGNTASPCIRSGARARNPDFSCTGEGKAQKRRDPSESAGWNSPWMTPVTRLSWVTSAVIACGRSEAWMEQGAGGHHAGFEIAPQRHHELAGQRHDGDAPQAPLGVADPFMEPAAQFAAGVMPDPHPGELDSDRPGAAVAGLADALFAPASPAVERRASQAEIAADFASV